MKIKVSQLRQIIREVVEEATSGARPVDPAFVSAVDALAETWNDWSSMEAKGDLPGTSGYSGGDKMDAVKKGIRGGAVSDPEAAEFVAAVKAIPWPSDDVRVRAALLHPWSGSGSMAPAVTSYLASAGLKVPWPGTPLERSPFAGHGGSWRAILLGGLDYAAGVDADRGVYEEDLAQRTSIRKAAEERRKRK